MSQRTAIAETKAVFEPLLQRIEDALEKLSDLVEAAGDNQAKPEEVEKAKEVILVAKERLERK